MRHLTRSPLLILALLLALVVAACGTDAEEPTDDVADDETAPATTDDEATEAADLPSFAMVLSGSTADGDFNALGRQALTDIGDQFGVETDFSEEVPVGDAARVAREYIADGFGVISMHTGLYLPITLELAPENPDTVFISQGATELEDEHPDNVWHIGRRFAYNSSFFIQGYLAGLLTETNTVAFIGGAELPDAISGVNSFFLGAREANPDVQLLHTFTGDFDDPVAARRAADSLVGQGADVLSAFLNAAIGGVAEAAEQAQRPTYFMALYTDKADLSPERYVMSSIWNFSAVFEHIFEQIAEGETSGYVIMSPENGGVVLEEIHNVPEDIEEQVRSIFEEFASGDRAVPDTSSEEVQVPES